MEKGLTHENNFDDEGCVLVGVRTFSKSKPEEIWVQCAKCYLELMSLT